MSIYPLSLPFAPHPLNKNHFQYSDLMQEKANGSVDKVEL